MQRGVFNLFLNVITFKSFKAPVDIMKVSARVVEEAKKELIEVAWRRGRTKIIFRQLDGRCVERTGKKISNGL